MPKSPELVGDNARILQNWGLPLRSRPLSVSAQRRPLGRRTGRRGPLMRMLPTAAVAALLSLTLAAPAFADANVGTEGDDVYVGTNGPDQYDGLGGDDTISGGAAVDTLYGGNGNDSISGGAGADYLNGGNGDNTLDPGPGADETYGGTGNDTITLVNDDALDVVQCGGGYDVVILVGGYDTNDQVGATCEEVRF
ncbi:hypothetical protein EPD65_11585 [Nocardioides jejuensis]|uniref:Calcium-binding protein n=2 Tax=Nocardioides jejuensis TaxID=2502782 RepID=A0A4V2NXZ4_9ACTN|nr:hypothetical protein EPD65_11585 [Nocardioides jejuensis]